MRRRGRVKVMTMEQGQAATSKYFFLVRLLIIMLLASAMSMNGAFGRKGMRWIRHVYEIARRRGRVKVVTMEQDRAAASK